MKSKKLFGLLTLLLTLVAFLVLLIAVPVMAAPIDDTNVITLPQSLLTLQDLTTLGGLVVAVYVIVSFFKEGLKGRFGDWIVRPFSVVVALIIMLWLVYVQGTISSETVGLAIINAFLVAMVAGAAHDYIVSPTKAKAIQNSNLTSNTGSTL